MDGTTATRRTGIPVRNVRALARRAGPEIVVFDPDRQEFHLLNAGAVLIWEMCDGQTSPEGMVSEICEFSNVDRADITADVERILSEFDDKGLLTWKS